MKECRIEITPEAGQLSLRIEAPSLGAAPSIINRTIPVVSADVLDDLRSGDPAPEVVREVTKLLSEWLELETPNLDLRTLLGLAQPDGEPLRLVFSVQGVSDQLLRANLTDLPLELLAPSTSLGNPLALHPRISSIVYLLPKQAHPPAPGPRSWPLRLLIVRSNPQDLQQIGLVPPAADIRQRIRNLRPDLGPDLLQIDVLSSEDAPDLIGRPTKSGLFERIEAGYDILIYLGHGDMRQTHADQFPVGVLQLETDDGLHADPLDGPRLSDLLVSDLVPVVPVVLLVGCLTAAEGLSAEVLGALKEEIPVWMRGSRAVAQALIDGQSGVQFVVGMRFRIEVTAATLFLEAFFKSFLGESAAAADQTAGNLERAVRRARQRLRVLGDQDLSWAAPLIFRTLGEEPMFPFLASLPTCPVLPQEAVRQGFWGNLAAANGIERSLPLFARFVDMVKANDQELIAAHTQQNRLLIMPALTVVAPEDLQPAPNQTTVSIPIELRAPLDVASLDFTLSVAGDDPARIVRHDAAPAAALQAAGYRILAESPQENTIEIAIERESGSNPLPAGPLFAIEIAIGATTQRVYTIELTDLKTTPPRMVCASRNAIIVPQP